MTERTPPTSVTAAQNAAALAALPFGDTRDFDDARRGLLAPLPNGGVVHSADGKVVWNLEQFQEFVDRPAPDSANPSLWRQTQLLAIGGLFHVAGPIYQVRSADISNVTFIESDQGVIVVDPLISTEVAAMALALYRSHRGDRPVVAVLYTHSHVDHFGGVRGVLTDEEISSGSVPIIAPSGFLKAALDENLLAGNAMTRRAIYMYGNRLEVGDRGLLSNGLGLATSNGEVALVPPTVEITEPIEERRIDGVNFTFMLAPDTEAPAEFLFYLPEYQALCSAEEATHVLHNLYTLRGAKVRDARAWSHYLNETLERFGEAEVCFAQHHWPTWGRERVREFLVAQRDAYRFIHDQTLRLANGGATMPEIAAELRWPADLGSYWCNRGYYGSLNHNSRAVYNFYLGYFDGNPAHLDPYPPVEAGKRYVALAGGPEALVADAEQAYRDGDYRWAAELASHLVFADPEHAGARDLLARSFEQLAYVQENGVWRNFYLTGATELREPLPEGGGQLRGSAIVNHLSIDALFSVLAIRLVAERAEGLRLSITFEFTDDEPFVLELCHSVLHAHRGRRDLDAAATLSLSTTLLRDSLLGRANLLEAMERGEVVLDGSGDALFQLLGCLEQPPFWFKIVEP